MFHQDWDEVTIHGKSVTKEKEKEKSPEENFINIIGFKGFL